MKNKILKLTIRINPFRQILILSLFSGLFACSSLIVEDVEYNVYHTPTKKYKRLRFIGVTKVDKVPALTKYLTKEMRKCRLYSKANGLDKVFKLSPQSDENKLKQELKTQGNQFQDARYVHGLLVVEILKNQTKTIKRNRNIWNAKDSQHYSWIDAYGNAAFPDQDLYAYEAISPKIKYEVNARTEKELLVEMSIRAVLYNKRSNQIVFDEITSLSGQYATYEASDMMQPQALIKKISEQLLRRVARKSCPKIGRVERKLIGINEDGRAHGLNERGIDAADDNKWERAADFWKKAILVDKKYAPALHNLGVYYERSGDIPRAMEEFGKAKAAGMPDPELRIQFDDSLELFRPSVESWSHTPTVSSISGANWLQIHHWHPSKYKVGEIHPVYRSELAIQKDGRVLGTKLFQTGKIKVIKREGDTVIARVVEMVENYKINPGDVVPMVRSSSK